MKNRRLNASSVCCNQFYCIFLKQPQKLVTIFTVKTGLYIKYKII